jgi:hypothetical protein
LPVVGDWDRAGKMLSMNMVEFQMIRIRRVDRIGRSMLLA